MWSSYSDVYFHTNDEKVLIDKRLELIRFANEEGIKAAARFYKCSKNTVKKWMKRFALRGKYGLVNQSRKPKTSPKRIAKKDINKIKECVENAKAKGKYITVNNIRRTTKILDYSDGTINRYINLFCGKTKNKKHINKKSDVSWKGKILPFIYWQIDIKYLTDIDNLKPNYKILNEYDECEFMKYQITARDMATGFAIVAYCNEKSEWATRKFLEEIFYPFLKQFKHLDLKKIKVQTDSGSEFTNKNMNIYGKQARKSGFTVFIEQNFRIHKINPPSCPTHDSDVETFHWSIERDCLAWDDIVDNESLIYYTTKYIEKYNNSIIKKRGYSPIEKLKEAYEIDKIKFPKPQIITM